MNKKFSINILVFLISILSCYAQDFRNIHSISNNRMPSGDNGYTLDGVWMTGSADKILNNVNFGPNGTYSTTVFSIISDYSTSNSLSVIDNIPNIDLFFFGSFDKNNPSLIPFTNTELDSLYKWSMTGGKMIIGASSESPPTTPLVTNLSILNSRWDFDISHDLTNAAILASNQGFNSTIFNGAFGSIGTPQNPLNQGGSLRGFFDVIPNNCIILGEDWAGNPTLILDCKTLDLIVSDIDAYTGLGNISNGPLISTDNDRFWANTIVYMDSLQNQPVISQNGNLLYTTSLYSSYQWYKDSIAVVGADSSSYNIIGHSGNYYLEVSLDCGCNNVVSNSINIGYPSTWSCIGSSCVDSGFGMGMYTDSLQCVLNCTSSTWDCIGSVCVDPGNGMGMYTDSLLCQLNCVSTDLLNIKYINNGKPIKIIDVLGRETKGNNNEPLFYIYNDGAVQKKIIIE